MGKVFRQKGMKWCIIFLAVFTGCFLVSRGIYGALLPNVQTQTPSYINLAHQVKSDGVFVAEEKEAVYGEEGLRISKVFVKAGENVQAGSPLFQYDLDDLKKLVEEKEYELKKLKVQLETESYNRSLEEAQKEKAKARAQEDLTGAKDAADGARSRAEEQLRQAKEEKASLPEKKEYIQEQKEKEEGYQQRIMKLEEAAAAGEDVSALKKELKQYEKTLKEALAAQWEQKNAELEQAVREGEENLSDVKRQNGQTVSQAERSLEDTKEASAKESSYELNKMEAGLLETEIGNYQKILEEEGVVYAALDGSVLEILGKEGERVQDGAVLWLADFRQGVYFETSISKEDKKYVNIEDEVTIRKSNGENLTGKIVSVGSEEKEGQYTVQASVTENCAVLENGTMDLIKKAGESRLAVPLSALHKEDGNYFVYTASEQNTILGTEWVIGKVNVSVDDKNETYATVSEGALSEKDFLVTYSTKSVKEGDVVRLQKQ